MATSSFTIR